MPEEPVGWNPTKKLLPKNNKKRIDPNNALIKHRRFLRSLEENKTKDKEERDLEQKERDERKKKFAEAAAQQRKKVKELKKDDQFGELNDDGFAQEPLPQARLTEENLKKSEQLSQVEAAKKKEKKSQGSKRPKQKPAWALTEKEQEDVKEKEIDDLLEFAYELDYEKYMDDFEVRQALAIIKDRITEIKKDDDWKEKMAKEWNEAGDDQGPAADY